MDVLERTLFYDEVTEIFVRVNSLGRQVAWLRLGARPDHCEVARSVEDIPGVSEACEKAGFVQSWNSSQELGRVCVRASRKFLTVGGLTSIRFRQAWKSCVPGMEFALDFMRDNVGIDSPVRCCLHRLLVVTLATMGTNATSDLVRGSATKLRHWVLLANAKARYSRGSSETLSIRISLLTPGRPGADEFLDRLRPKSAGSTLRPRS